ncbi:MAG: cytochrome c family protein [Steroidobacteraceae bacterium]
MNRRIEAMLAMVMALGSVAALAQAPAAGAPDLKRGKLLFIQCRACHELQEGLPHKVGPNLFAAIGAKAASLDDFNYSAALRGANLTWDEATLDRWIEKPSAVVPGNAMAFAGVANPKDRAALIAYILAETRGKKK